jgi:integrase/recombinase XerD
MANVKIILYTSKKLKEDKHPIVLRVTHERKRRYFTLGENNKGYSCLPDHWNEETSRFRKSHPDYKILNQILMDLEKEASGIILRFDLENEEFSFDKFTQLFGREKPKDNVKEIFDYEVKQLEKAGRIGYSKVYNSTWKAIEEYSPGISLRLRDIDYKFLIGFESHLLGKEDKKNTASVYMRTLRTLFNNSIKYGYIKEEHYPFLSRNNPNGYSLRGLKQETRPRAISKEAIRKIRDQKLDEKTTLFEDRNLFMFSYYCRGINYHDIAHLKWSNLDDGRLKYKRAKTGGLLDMALLEPAIEIIDYYRKKSTSSYIFPILNDDLEDPKAKYSRIKNGLKRFNKNLKKICKKAEIDPITSYVSRHTWATVMKMEGHSTEIISESLDHKSTSQTTTYLRKFETEILDEANKSIL